MELKQIPAEKRQNVRHKAAEKAAKPDQMMRQKIDAHQKHL